MAVIKIIYYYISCNSNLRVILNKAVLINKEVLSYTMRLATQKMSLLNWYYFSLQIRNAYLINEASVT